MGELKRKNKIILGISITVLTLALIAAIIILAVNSTKKDTVLYSQEYSALDTFSQNEKEYINIHDGVYIAKMSGGYCLVTGEKTISKKYASVSLIDTEKMIYEFSTYSGEYGLLDADGKEIKKVSSSGNFVNPDKQYKDYDFTYSIESDRTYTVSYSNVSAKGFENLISFKNVYKSINSNDNTSIFEGDAGFFIASKSSKTYLVSLVNAGEPLLIEYSSVLLLEKHHIATLGTDNIIRYYSLPSLAEVTSLQGVGVSDVIFGDGYITKKITGGVMVGDTLVNSGDLILTGVEKKVGNKILFLQVRNSLKALIYDGQNVYSGDYSNAHSLYKVGDKLFNANLDIIDLTAAGETDSAVTALNFYEMSPEKIYYSVDGRLCSYDGVSLTLLLNSYTTTHGKAGFEKKEYVAKSGIYKTEYYTYFICDNVVYDENIKEVYRGESVTMAGAGIVKDSGIYKEIGSKRTVSGADGIYKAYIQDGDYSDFEYLFEKKISETENVLCDIKENVQITFPSSALISGTAKLQNGAFIAFDGSCIYAGSDKHKYSNYQETIVESTLFSINGNSVSSFEISKKGFALKTSYYIEGAAFEVISMHGMVIKDKNGKIGFIDKKGKMLIEPTYDNLISTKKYFIAEQNGTYAMLDLGGKKLTGFVYTDYEVFGDFMLASTFNGTKELVSNKGRILAKNITGNSVYGVSYVTYKNELIIDNDVKYFFIFTNGNYRAVKVFS